MRWAFSRVADSRSWVSPESAPASAPATAAPAPGAVHASRLRARGCLLSGQPDGEIRAESIDGFFHRLMLVFAVSGDTREVDELYQDAAIAAGGEYCAMHGHGFTSWVGHFFRRECRKMGLGSFRKITWSGLLVCLARCL